ncbi:hypothetical protein PTTG_03279 [Puccinia triticina 1-1 BBBD Race 1]|uniref:Uncharacterized protein n=1 Tax=Puccinia triticina (isolate 1-1 / race 1 (BBBD)) TaxID=630390 RepID=A0A180GHH9_PUCT1|nr:hypothetical protein PTTG_03279 [Puccinia triticina 1-1 BBBD Race 1]
MKQFKHQIVRNSASVQTKTSTKFSCGTPWGLPPKLPWCTLLRSERRQAGKKEFVTSCTKLKEILEQALGLSESIPVPPATIISGIREIQEQCQKRKRGESFLISSHAYHRTHSPNFPDVNKGKPIPPEDLIDLTNKTDDEDADQSNQATSGSKPFRKRPCAEANKFLLQQPSSQQCPLGQSIPDLSGPSKDADANDAQSPKGQISDLAALAPHQDTTHTPLEPAASSTVAAPTSNRQELANPHPSATSTSEKFDANLTIQHSTGSSPATNTPLPPSTAPQDHPSQSLSATISLAGPTITPVNPSKIPPVLKPPAPPMITLLKSTTNTGSTSDSPTASHEKSSPATSKPSDQLNQEQANFNFNKVQLLISPSAV